MAFPDYTTQSAGRPAVSTHDSGYEHSLEHLLELHLLVEEADEDRDPEAESP